MRVRQLRGACEREHGGGEQPGDGAGGRDGEHLAGRPRHRHRGHIRLEVGAVSVASVISRTVVLFQRRDCLELHQVEEQRAQQRRRQLGAGLRVHGDHGGVGRRGVLHREVRVLEQISSANVLCRQYVCKKGDLQQTATTAPTACSCGTGWTAK